MAKTDTKGAPEGYRSTKKPNIEGYWLPEHGPIHGRILGAFEYVNKLKRMTRVYVLRLAEPCVCTVKADRELVEDRLDKNAVVGVFSTGFLPGYLENCLGAVVWINRLPDKVRTSNGDAWDYDVRADRRGKPIVVETRVSKERQPERERQESYKNDYTPDDSDDIDDLPF